RPKYILIFFVISIPSLVLMYRSIMGMEDRSLGEVITAIISRTFTGQISAAYFYLEIFPDQHDFLLGKSLPNPKGIFPWEHYNITVEVMNYISPSLAEKNIVGSAPTVFWAEMYANFAVGGIIISSILVGSALFFIQLVILRLPMNPIIVGMYTWIVLYLKNLTLTGLSTFIINIDFVVVLFVGILLSIVTGCTSKKLSIRINN